jgi:DNA-binding NarL/FixJ family response regulator
MVQLERPANRSKIRVLITEHTSQLQEALRAPLHSASDIDVAGIATHDAEAVQMAAELQPDIVLIGANTLVIYGITVTQRIIERSPMTQIIVVVDNVEPDDLRRAMLAGARDFLTRPISDEELVSTIQRVYRLSRLRRPHEPELLQGPSEEDAYGRLKARMRRHVMQDGKVNEGIRDLVRMSCKEALRADQTLLTAAEHDRLLENVLKDILHEMLGDT